ncbi:hypothetical protein BEV13_03375 [Rickettsiella grylli]|uniref:hypothetical protein n=1 Tax=Rickettsiella grylli TaxID=59196 RepID=UPI00091098DB|nr:hypothetical protein [Rickettsiella grylli]OJA00518.1 hypothetical protein BEV13_03375 [Rickettsiella grylli]
MPTYNNTSDKLHADVFNGRCAKDCVESVTPDSFTEFLKEILLTGNAKNTDSTLLSHHCIAFREEKNELNNMYLLHLLTHNQWANLLTFLGDYITIKKNALSEDNICDLIFLTAHFNAFYEKKMNNTSLINHEDVRTFSNFLYFFERLLALTTIQEIVKPHDEPFSQPQHMESLIGHTNALLDKLILKCDPQSFISNEIVVFVERLGKFGFKANKMFPSSAGRTDTLLHDLLKKPFSKNISRESIAWIYLNQYCQGNAHEIKEKCAELDLHHCHPPKTQLFEDIISGEKVSHFSLGDFKTVENEIFWSMYCDRFTLGKNTHILGFLKDFLNNNKNTMGGIELTRWLKFVSYHIAQLSKTKTTPDFFNSLENLSYLLFNIIQRAQKPNTHDQFHVINEFVRLYQHPLIVEQTSPLTKPLSNTLSSHLFGILGRMINYENEAALNYDQFIHIIKMMNDLSKPKIHLFNSKKVAVLSFKSLGALYRKSLNISSQRMNTTQKTIKETLLLIKSLKDDLTSQQLRDAVSYFFKPKIKQRILNAQCQQLFGLTGCRPTRFINASSPFDDVTNETMSTTSRTGDPSQSENLISVNASHHRSPSTIASRAPSLQITPEPQSTTETSTPVNHHTLFQNSTALTESHHKTDTAAITPSVVELSASAAHGAFSGMLNGITHYFAVKHAYQNEHRLTRCTPLLYCSMVGQASLAATFPLMLNEIQKQLNVAREEDDSSLSTVLLEQSLPIFMSSLGVHFGLQLIRDFTYLFNTPWVRLLGGNILPFASTLVSAIKNPLPTATHVGTSIATSSLIYGVLDRIAPVKQTKHHHMEANEIEMKPLHPEKITPQVNGSVSIEKEIIEKTFLYISQEKFEQIKNHSHEILNILETLSDSLDKNIKKLRSKIEPDTLPAVANTYQKILDDQLSVLQLIQQEEKACRQEVSFLTDDHSAAYQKYTISTDLSAEAKKEIKAHYTSAMEKLGNVFKRMETMFNTMKSNLGKALGYISGARDSFPDNDHTQEGLNDVIGKIPFPLSLIKLYLNTYSTSQAAEQAEKRGVIRALSHQQFFEKLSSENNLNSKRPKKTRVYSDNRSHSMMSDAKTLSSASDESSVVSVGSSKDNEEVQIVRPLLNPSV